MEIVDVGFKIKKINDSLQKKADKSMEEMDLTFSQHHVLVYLIHCENHETSLKNVEKEFMFGQNYFQKLGGKFYSSSNNANVKSKRNKKFEMLNHLFSESRYSNDEPELDYISEGVSSQTNSIAYK